MALFDKYNATMTCSWVKIENTSSSGLNGNKQKVYDPVELHCRKEVKRHFIQTNGERKMLSETMFNFTVEDGSQLTVGDKLDGMTIEYINECVDLNGLVLDHYEVYTK